MADVTVSVSRWCIIEEHVSLREGVEIGPWTWIQSGCSLGKNTIVRDHCILYRDVVIGEGCDIGPSVHIERGVVISDQSKVKSMSFVCEGVTIGKRVFVAHGVLFCNEKYPQAVRLVPWVLKEEDRIAVEAEVFIGSGAVILPGVTIGQGARVGAGAVVTGPVQPYATVLGIPARRR